MPRKNLRLRASSLTTVKRTLGKMFPTTAAPTTPAKTMYRRGARKVRR